MAKQRLNGDNGDTSEAGDREERAELESFYSPEYLRDCADAEARQERLDELKRRIALGAYRIDPESVAEQMLGRADLEQAQPDAD